MSACQNARVRSGGDRSFQIHGPIAQSERNWTSWRAEIEITSTRSACVHAHTRGQVIDPHPEITVVSKAKLEVQLPMDADRWTAAKNRAKDRIRGTRSE